MLDAASPAGVELLSKQEPAGLPILAGPMSEREFGENRSVVWLGDLGDEFFIIRSGRVEVCVPD